VSDSNGMVPESNGWPANSPLLRDGPANNDVDKPSCDRYSDHMTMKVTASEAKAKILSLLDDVAAGEVVEITKRGRTVARLVPATGPHALKGSLAGVAMTSASEDELFATGASWNLE
jgi:prevent-host-death family protein